MKNPNQISKIYILAAVLLCALVKNISAQTIIADAIPTSYDVPPSGAFTYNIPLRLPPGIKDMMPQLAINYNSQGGNGTLGMGWGISGMSSITRTQTTIFHDNKVEQVSFTTVDALALDGQRLFPDATDQTKYYTEVKNFADIRAHGTYGYGADYFVVEQTDGTKYEYGNSVDSKMLGNGTAGNGNVLMWALSKVYDRNSNYMEFEYYNNSTTGEYKITKIKYAGNQISATAPSSEIIFGYQTRPDKSKVWKASSQIIDQSILEYIEVRHNNQVVNRYEFTYDVTSGMYTRLTQIKEIRGNQQLPPINITWNNPPSQPSEKVSVQNLSNYTFQNYYFPVDINADGMKDIVELPPNNSVSVPYDVHMNFRDDDFVNTTQGTLNYAYPGGYMSSTRDGKMFMDYNGDGKEDMIIIIRNTANNLRKLTIEYHKSNGHGFDYESTLLDDYQSHLGEDWLGGTSILPGDFDGDGKKEILLVIPIAMTSSYVNTYNAYIIGENYPTSGGGFQSVNWVGNFQDANHASFLGDFNGDGKDEYMRTIDAYQSFEVYKINTICTGGDPGDTYAAHSYALNGWTKIYTAPYPTRHHRIWSGDFNGDGIADMLTWVANGWDIAYGRGNDLQSTSLPMSLATTGPNQPSYFCYYTNDFNGDGKDDILELQSYPNHNPQSVYRIYYSRGNNEFVQDAGAFGLEVDYPYLKLGDFNGDGSLDFLGKDENSGIPATFSLFYFRKNDMSNTVKSISHAGNKINVDTRILTQGNILNLASTLYAVRDPFYTRTLLLSDHHPYEEKGWTNVTYPFYTYRAPIKVVQRIWDDGDVATGISGVDQTYKYGNLIFNAIGLGSRGFRYTWITDDVKKKYTEKCFNPTQFRIPTLEYTAYCDIAPGTQTDTTRVFGNHTPLIITENKLTHMTGGAGGKSVIMVPYSNTTWNYLDGTAKKTSYYYSGNPSPNFYYPSNIQGTMVYEFGRPDHITESSYHSTSFVQSPGGPVLAWFDFSKTEFVYDATAAFYNRAKPIEVISNGYYPNKPSSQRKKKISYNTEGLVLSEITDDNSAYKTTTTYQYDDFGHVDFSQLVPDGMPAVDQHFTYTTDGRFLERYKNAYDYIDDYTYNIWGAKLSHISPKGLISTYQYDAVNRVVSETLPKPVNQPTSVVTTTQYTFVNGAPDAPSFHTAHFMTTTHTNGIQADKIEFYDIYNRKIRDAYTSFDGSTMTYEDTKYLPNGLVDYNTAPYFKNGSPSTIVKTTFQYNSKGQLVLSTTDHNGPVISTQHEVQTYADNYPPKILRPLNKKTTVTNTTAVPKKKMITYTDARGVTYQVDDQDNTIVYDFNSNGKHDAIVINGDNPCATSFTYELGYLKTKTEPNLGTEQYSYYASGQLQQKTDGSGNIFTYSYDLLGRPLTKTGSDGVYSYSYDNTNGYGTTGSLYAEYSPYNTYTLHLQDNYGRPYQKYDIAGSQVLITETTYDQFGRPETYKYPSGDIIRSHYNNAGSFYKVSVDNGNGFAAQDLYQIDQKDHRGVVLQGTHFVGSGGLQATGYVENYTYMDPGFPQTAVVTNNITATPIASMTYDFDPADGNLKSRTDNVHNLSESFAYDPFDRLLNIHHGSLIPLQMEYDFRGNILRKTDVSTSQYLWKYDKHAITLVPEPNNNGIPLATQEVTYYPFNKAKKITEHTTPNHEWVEYTYSAAEQRALAVYSSGGTPYKETYYSDNYEKTNDFITSTTKEVSYVWAEGAMVAMLVHDDASSRIYHVVTDYQGSITHILDNQGTANNGLVHERNYDPWGRMRNPANWQYLTSTPAMLITDRGYTGHEHLNKMNIINMNGRLYDPLIGRMFTPDPFVADKASSQAYNKYSYCLNNPLKYTDPSGEILWFVPLIYAAVNVASDLAMNDGNMNFGQIAMSAAQGAIGGALSGIGAGLSSKMIANLGGIQAVAGQAFGSAVLNQIGKFSPSVSIYQSRGFNLNLSPSFGFGTSGFTIGGNLDAFGDSYSVSVGAGFNSGMSSLGEAAGGSGYWNAGASFTVPINNTPVGAGVSYNSFGGKTAQGVAAGSVQVGDFSVRLDEDYFGDRKDRFRTGGLLVTYKINEDLTLAFGGSMMTGQADPNQKPLLYGHSTKGTYNPDYEKLTKLRGGTAYGGVIYKGQAYFGGNNSEKRLHTVQNFIHRHIVATSYFYDWQLGSRTYSYYGTYHPNFLFY